MLKEILRKMKTDKTEMEKKMAAEIEKQLSVEIEDIFSA